MLSWYSPKKGMLAFLAFGVVLLLFLYGGDLRNYLSLHYIKQHRDSLHFFVTKNYGMAAITYTITCMIGVVCFLPFSALLTLLGGYLFGPVMGTLYVNVGATLGATISFLLVRYLIGDYLQQRYEKDLVSFNQALTNHEIRYLLMIHLIALVPFPVANILAGLTRIHVWRFIWTTSVGIFPISFMYALAGKQLMELNTVHEVLTTRIMLIIALLLLVTVLPIIAQYMYTNSQKKEQI
ncbi:MAG: VTT domain-containing protein [Candidatus Babeliales bacterium]